MLSNQKQIIEQAKFTYSPLGKAFKEQMKTTTGQGEKQVDALKTLKPIKSSKSDDNEKLLKYKEIFDKLSNERIGEIYNIAKQIDFNNLTYYFKNYLTINFVGFRGPMYTYNNIKNGNTSIEKIEEDQEYFKSNLSEITKGNTKYKSKVQLNTKENIKNVYKSREKVIKLCNDYAEIRSEAM